MVRPRGIVVDAGRQVDLFHRFVCKDDVISRPRIDKDLSVPVKDRTARCRYRDQSNTLVLGTLGIICAL